jgi:hypothetical protein
VEERSGGHLVRSISFCIILFQPDHHIYSPNESTISLNEEIVQRRLPRGNHILHRLIPFVPCNPPIVRNQRRSSPSSLAHPRDSNGVFDDRLDAPTRRRCTVDRIHGYSYASCCNSTMTEFQFCSLLTCCPNCLLRTSRPSVEQLNRLQGKGQKRAEERPDEPDAS